jgi:hypothetical protein
MAADRPVRLQRVSRHVRHHSTAWADSTSVDRRWTEQVSGTYGSRQEEAQRLGRILRPKKNGAQAHFYALVTRDTVDQTFAANRQLFLTEQGYRYTITDHV